MTNDQLNDALRTLLERIDALERRANDQTKATTEVMRLVNERLDNHAEQIKIVDGKVNDVATALVKYVEGGEWEGEIMPKE